MPFSKTLLAPIKKFFSKNNEFWYIPALFVITAIAFFPAGDEQDFFISDDIILFTDNVYAKRDKTESYLQLVSHSQVREFVPIGWLFIVAELKTAGGSPRSIRLISFLLHATIATFVFVVFRRIPGVHLASSFVLAAIFAVHPVNVEVVTFGAGQFWLLGTLFSWCALYSYQRFLEETRNLYLLVLSWVLFAGAVFTKTALIAFAFTFPALGYLFFEKPVYSRYNFGFFSIIILKSLHTLTGESDFVSGGYIDGNILSSVVFHTQFLWKSIRDFLLPITIDDNGIRISLSAIGHFEVPRTSHAIASTLITFAIASSVLTALVFRSTVKKPALFALILYLSFQFLFIGIFPNQWWPDAARYEYPGGPGLLFLFLQGLPLQRKKLTFIILPTALLVFVPLTIVYRDIWTHRQKWHALNQRSVAGTALGLFGRLLPRVDLNDIRYRETPFSEHLPGPLITKSENDFAESYLKHPDCGRFELFYNHVRVLSFLALNQDPQISRLANKRLIDYYSSFPMNPTLNLHQALIDYHSNNFEGLLSALEKWENNERNYFSEMKNHYLEASPPEDFRLWFLTRGDNFSQRIRWNSYWLFFELSIRANIKKGDRLRSKKLSKMYFYFFPKARSNWR